MVALIHTYFADTLKKDPLIARSDANETYRPKRSKMSLLLGVRDFGISLKVTFIFNFWPVAIILRDHLGIQYRVLFERVFGNRLIKTACNLNTSGTRKQAVGSNAD